MLDRERLAVHDLSRKGGPRCRSDRALTAGGAPWDRALCGALRSDALRCTILILDMPASVWSVGAILSASSPIVLPLTVVPAAGRVVVGA